MWKRGHWFARVLREEANPDGGAGGGGPAAGTPGAESGAPAAGGSGDPSLLSTAAPAATFDYIPEKYRVSKADGAFDIDASSKRLAEAHTALEARLGSGDVRPKAAADYVVTVPDALKEAFDPKTDAGMQKFLAGAHEKGYTQAQIDFAMANYFEMAPNLAAGAVAADASAATAALQQTWKTPEAMKENLGHAYSATSVAAEKAGLQLDVILNGPLGNNPEFMRLMAAIGPEFAEDAGIGADAQPTVEDVKTLMASEAYSNSKHPDHVRVSEKIRRHYEKTVGTAPVGG